MQRWLFLLVVLLTFGLASGCQNGEAAAGDGPPAGRRASSSAGRAGGGMNGFSGGGFGDQQAAVPVEVVPVERRAISSYLETNGTLEAEHDVDLVARVAGPVTELKVEEGMRVEKGQLLAMIDPDEVRARMEISRVNRNEAKLAYERAQALYEQELLSREAYDQALSNYESAEAQLRGDQLVFDYTSIEAPFAGVVSVRYVKLAQYVSVNQPLFRVTSFDPLLCPIQVPERELPRLTVGQPGYVKAEAWRDERFAAKVLRISPVVEAATGTVKVTLEVAARGKLRPGMFVKVYLETETRDDALVIPKAALSLESIGDTVYVATDGTASRREVELGFQEGDDVEVRDGLAEGERVIVVGQDGLSDGTPIRILGGPERSSPQPPSAGRPPFSKAGEQEPEAAPEAPGGRGGWGGGGRPGFDPSRMTPEQLEGIKQRMRERGMSDEQIEERLKQMKERAGGGGAPRR